jgi:hypothetical protein
VPRGIVHHTDERITIELSHDEWIALLASAFYGSDALASNIGGHTAELADRLIEQLKSRLHIDSIRDEALKMEILNQPVTQDRTDKTDFNPTGPDSTPRPNTLLDTPLLEQSRAGVVSGKAGHCRAYSGYSMGSLPAT